MVQRITDEEIKTMGYTFLSVSNIDVGEPCFYFDAELNPCQQFLIFLSFMNIANSC